MRAKAVGSERTDLRKHGFQAPQRPQFGLGNGTGEITGAIIQVFHRLAANHVNVN
jgi:hypothetical protein